MLKSDIIESMKRFLAYFCIGLFLFCPLWLLGALELELTAGANYMSPHETDWPIMGKFSLRGEIPEAWAFEFNLERDNFFLNNADFRLKTRKELFGFEFGVFAGLDEDFSALDMGFLGSMEVTWPGVIFLSVGGASTIGSQFGITGSGFRESAEARFGFWLPFAVVTLSANTKNYTHETGVHDTLLRYKFSSDFFFTKTSGITLRIDAGYQTLSSDVYGVVNPASELNTWFTGLDFQFNVSKYLRFILGGEIPITDGNTPQDDLWGMFRAYGGIRITLF
jgi:hypothetical protein